ncbi:DUF1642 domain-containing protein [Carnobacterium maltaromaticum]|uniref:DUF1642 domain-containing protein n=1 Tax=Carnobacterium maltaromaticum TaxID=2751 RepID=UPI0039BE47E9
MTNKLEEVLKELQESHVLIEKVKVPKFIADWIEDHKAQYSIWDSDSKGEFIIRCSVDLYRYDEGLSLWDYKITDKVSDWIDENKFGFISSVLFGYETEEEKAKFEVGEYYFSYTGILKVTGLGSKVAIGDIYITRTGNWMKDTSILEDSAYFEKARKATDEEIKLFKRAEMYHKHGRKLDELRVDDFVKSGNDIYQITQTKGFVESIIDGKHELYLTLEEAQEAHKKIVGE